MDVKYYLVTVCDKGLQRTVEFSNHVVVGLHPTEWFTLTKKHITDVLVNFWEIREYTFEEFTADEQNAAWDLFHEFGPNAVED